MPEKLELNWIGKPNRPRLEPRVLVEEKEVNGTPIAKPVSKSENRLIFGDNLLALKALEQEFSGRVKCVYIDPPYNTGSAFEHYDDGIEHSVWLSLMRDRIELLRRLLTEDGSLWISIDDNEAHYLKVLCDEIFGRANFVATIIWEKRKSRENRRAFSFNHDYILVYAKEKARFEAVRNLLDLSDEVQARYKNPDGDPRGPWQSISALAQAGHATTSQFYTLTTPSGKKLDPPKGNCWRYTKTKMEQEIAAGRIWFGKDGTNVPRIKRYLRENPDDGLTPETIWPADEVGTNDTAKKDLLTLLPDAKVFDNPKPEGLMQRLIHIATNEGDIVLDSFAGSGTTGAVAHKMGRRWIMIELGEHCHTHIIPRLNKVVDGSDGLGVSAALEWKGGGSYRYFRLAPSLLNRDEYGNWVISPKYNGAMLAEALCKFEGYRYEPSAEVYWQHGRSTDGAYIYVTTQTLTADQLQHLNEEVGPKRSLLVCCGSYAAKSADAFPRLTIKKIPKAVLHRCEWGRDDYSLAIKELPPTAAEERPAKVQAAKPEAAAKRKERKSAVSLLNFGDD